MNWLQKIAKIINTSHIPWQISASISALLGTGEWEVAHRPTRNWEAWNTKRAMFRTLILGKNIKHPSLPRMFYEAKLFVRYTLPFNEDQNNKPTMYDSKLGREDLEFVPGLTLTIYGDGIRNVGEVISGPIMNAPHEIAQWVVDHINGEGDKYRDPESGPDNDDNNDEPDLFPQWPYSENIEEHEESMVVLPGQLRGGQM